MSSTNRYARSGARKQETTTRVVDRAGPLLAVLVDLVPRSRRRRIKAVLRDRQVLVDGRPVTRFDYPLVPGQRIEICWQPALSEQLPYGLKIVFEDQDLIVIDKPAGLLTVATAKEKRKTAYALLSQYVKTSHPENKIFVIHRLDQETSGLLMFARREAVQEQIQKTWEEAIRERTYVAVVEGVIEPDAGTISSWLAESSAFKVYSSRNPNHGRRSVTHYRKIGGNKTYSLVELNLETGRKHQIRVHLQDIGFPVLGDKKYGSGTNNPLGRLGLHASVLAFIHPESGEVRRFESGVPAAFLKLTARRQPAPVPVDGSLQPKQTSRRRR
ncbi:MAG: RluA family pseudouridine synthase [Desulfofustis sp.]|nr:RluA family pseudouridine synthase [Desulfofustis sp.]